MNNQIILRYLNSLSYFTIKEVLRFVYLANNTHLHVNFKSDSDDPIKGVDISAANVNNYLPTYRKLLINQMLK